MAHELRSLLADRILWIALVAMALLFGYAVQVGARFAAVQQSQVEAASAADAERYRALGERLVAIEEGAAPGSPNQDPTRPYVLGRNAGQRSALLPVTPFQATAIGQSDLIPAVVPVNLDGADPRGTQEEIENPLHLMSGPLDLAFVITYLLPLLGLALSFDLYSREREAGTLALVLSQPVRPGILMLGKALTRWGLLFAAATAFGFAALYAFSGAPPLDRFLLWAGAVGLYLAFWIGIACIVNARGGSSAANAVALAFVWLVLVVLLPAGLQLSATLLHPVPSRADLVVAEREASRTVSEQASAVLAQYYEDHPELFPEGTVDVGDFQAQAFAVQSEVNRQVAPVRAGYQERLAGQRDLVRGLRWLSPAVLTYDILLQLAGTGDLRLQRFEGALGAFHDEWVAFFEPAIFRGDPMGSADLDRIPSWSFPEDQPSELRAGILPGLLWMSLLSALAATFTALSLSRYRTRPNTS